MESHNPCLLPFILKRTPSGSLITEPTEPEGSAGALIQAQGNLTTSRARGRHHTPRERMLSQALWDEGHHMEALENDSEVGDWNEEEEDEEIIVEEGSIRQPQTAVAVPDQVTPLFAVLAPGPFPETPGLRAPGSRIQTDLRESVVPWEFQNPSRHYGEPSPTDPLIVPSSPISGPGRPRPVDNANHTTTVRRLISGRLTIAGCESLEHSSATPGPTLNGTRRRLGHMPSSSNDSTSSDHSRKRRRAELRDSDAGGVPANRSGPEHEMLSSDLKVRNDTDVGSASTSYVSDNPQQLQQQMQASAKIGLASTSINPQNNHELSIVQTNNELPKVQTALTHTPQIDVLYLSHLIPRSYDMAKRWELLRILYHHAPYLPTIISTTDTGTFMERYNALSQLIQEDEPIEDTTFVEPPLGATGQGWPAESIPTEVMEQIVQYLPRDTLQNMRLVNREFEKRVSSVAFKTVVVPFRAEIYGMMVHDSKTKKPAIIDVKGKGKANDSATQTDNGDDEFYLLGDYCKVKAKDVYDGMKVFEAWGGHIKQFAMSFEIDQVTLKNPPVKKVNEDICSFWGNYIWPLPHYSRYDAVAGLEKKADQIRCMTTALSKLTEVYELGLCVDSGLGWLVGPDVSDRAKLLAHKSKVFGTRFAVPDTIDVERRQTWDTINHLLKDAIKKASRYLSGIDHVAVVPGPQPLTQTGMPLIFEDDNFQVATGMYEQSQHAYRDQQRNPEPTRRFHSTMTTVQTNAAKSLLPANLTDAQKEWLLETEWAQRAFLSSYCLALIDNSATFQHVRTLTISRLSSRYLVLLKRTDIWAALPKIDNITLLVSPDWRIVLKSDEGTVSTPVLFPSDATDFFRSFLETCVMTNDKVKTLQIGWADGGERAPGMCARNRHILPAPVMDIREGPDALTLVIPVLVLPHVQHLTFTNCWFTPTALKTFVNDMKQASLEILTLDSVSLTADHKAATPLPANQNNHPNRVDPIPNPFLRFKWAIGTHYVCVGLSEALCFYAHGGVVVTPRNGRAFGLDVVDPPTDPTCTAWLRRDPRKGSWGDVIDTLTPGQTLAYQKCLHAINPDDDVPVPRQCGKLTRINFSSCGYVRLTNATNSFHQHDIGRVVSEPPPCLQARYNQLTKVMLECDSDHFLGQIVPSMAAHEQKVLENGFGMQMGWGDDEAKWENLEDGQPEGGSGRFSGSVEAMGPGGNGAF